MDVSTVKQIHERGIKSLLTKQPTMKKFLLFASMCITISTHAQFELTVIPNTPLDYLSFELTTPKIKADYSKRTQYFGEIVYGFVISETGQKKYSDLPLYEAYKESIDFIGTVESKSSVTKTANYVSYILEVRETNSGPYTLFAKDTFFLSGTTITGISETIYDTENNTLDTYAQYDVIYHANGKIKDITLKPYTGSYLTFGGLSIVYNANGTIKTDTIYLADYNSFLQQREYQDHYYSPTNPLKIDSSYYYQIGANPLQNTRYYYVLNANNEILTQKVYTYNTNKYEYTASYVYGVDLSLNFIAPTAHAAIELYPNPVQDVVTISKDITFTKWTITSTEGRMVKQGSNTNENVIGVSDLNAGCYVITVSNDETSWTGKFIK